MGLYTQKGDSHIYAYVSSLIFLKRGLGLVTQLVIAKGKILW
jgi:hypothetical protein